MDEEHDCAGRSEINSSLVYPLICEFFGCLTINLFGCASTVQLNPDIPVTFVSIAFTFGFVYAVCISMFFKISGAHFNPAVTIGLMVINKVKLYRGVFYIVAQLIGSCIGSLLLYIVSPPEKDNTFFYREYTLGITIPAKSVALGQAMLIELLTTFFVMLTVLMTTETKNANARPFAPLAIGLVIIIGICAFGQYTGGSFNPSRSFGAALLADNWSAHWVYWVGPIIGAVTAALFFKCILEYGFQDEDEVEEEEEVEKEEKIIEIEEEERKPEPEEIQTEIEETKQTRS